MKFLLTNLLLLCCVAPLCADPLELRPLSVNNQAPLAMLYGLPVLENPRLLAEGSYRATFRWDLANNYTHDNTSDEQLLFDGESNRLAIRLERGLASGWLAGIELPLIAHRGGSLDGFIEGWHEFFNLPNGGREEAEKDHLNYSYTKEGQARFALEENETGLGDIRLLLSRQLQRSEDAALAVHVSLELPSGDADKLLGSDSYDLALTLSGDRLSSSSGERYALHYAAGLLFTDGGLLADQRRGLVATASLGGAWSFRPDLVLQLQLDAHSPLFDSSDLRQLDSYSAQLAIGGALLLSEATRLELAVVEDVVVETASDVVFHLLLSRDF